MQRRPFCSSLTTAIRSESRSSVPVDYMLRMLCLRIRDNQRETACSRLCEGERAAVIELDLRPDRPSACFGGDSEMMSYAHGWDRFPFTSLYFGSRIRAA